jgi:propionyl-CoA synthetase
VVKPFSQKISRTSTGFNSIRNKFNTMKYEEIYTRSIDQPEAFWAAQAKLNGIVNRKRFCRKTKMDIHFVQRWWIEYLLSHIRQAYSRWIWRSNRFIYDSSNTNLKKIHLFRSKTEVAKLAEACHWDWKGDTAIMPMIPQTAFAMLACARIGWFIRLFWRFCTTWIAIRIDDCKPEQS